MATEARVSQTPVDAAVQTDATPVRVTGSETVIGLVGTPSLIASSLTAQAVVLPAQPPVRTSLVVVQALVSWRKKQGFQAIWIE